MTTIPEFVVKIAYTEAEANDLVTQVETTNRLGLPTVINETLDFITSHLKAELSKHKPLAKDDRVYYANDKARLGTVLVVVDAAGVRYASVLWDEAGRSPVTSVPAKNLRRAD